MKMRDHIHLLSTALLAGALSACMSAGGSAESSGFPAFEYHRIDNIGRQIGQTALVDLDADGDLDYVAGQASRTGGDVWWWEYQAPDRWVRHDIGKGNTDVGGALHDVDGDGDLDMLAGSVLFLNTGTPRAPRFEAHDVETIYSHDTEFADIDGDGRVDALANEDEAGLFWYEIPADPTQPWTEHLIASAEDHEIHGGISPRAVGDLDGDGDMDVVTAEGWYENTDGAGRSWTPHMNIELGEKDRYGIAVRTWVADMDGDGDLDVVQSQADHSDGRVAWFENDGRGAFTRHIIKPKGGQLDFHSLAVADFDLDGDLDVFSCAGPLSANDRYPNFIWENTAGPDSRPTPERWVEHVVAERACHEAVAGDVDGDGDIDIAAKPWSDGDEHYYLRNLAR